MFLILFNLCLVLFNCFDCNLCGEYFDGSGIMKLKIYPKGRYEVDFSTHQKNYTHKGSWIKDGNNLFLNSDNQPTTGHLISYNEESIESMSKDSLLIVINSVNGKLPDGTVLFGPGMIRINNKNYYPDNGSSLLIQKPGTIETLQVYGKITAYPVYQVKNNDINKITIDLKATYENVQEVYTYGSFFTNQKLQIKEDTLMFNSLPLTKK